VLSLFSLDKATSQTNIILSTSRITTEFNAYFKNWKPT